MFETILKTPATNFPIAPSLFALAMVESFILGVCVVWVYRSKQNFSTQGQSFQTSMLIMAPLISLILLFIGSNLALSIGMVGALSIVRFRTILKDPLDLMYLFLLIAVGVGCGTYNFAMAAAGTFAILGILYFKQSKDPAIKGGILLVRDSNEESVAKFTSEFLRLFPRAARDRIDLSASGAEHSLVIADNTPELYETIERLRSAHQVEHVTYYTNKSEY